MRPCENKPKARQEFSEAGQAQFPRAFEVDDGNYHTQGDFYLGDVEAIDCVSKPEFDHDVNFCGSATWQDAEYTYAISMSRNEPDNANDAIRARVTGTLTLTNRVGQSQTKALKGLEVFSDNLADWIRDCMDASEFEDDFTKLKAKLRKAART